MNNPLRASYFLYFLEFIRCIIKYERETTIRLIISNALLFTSYEELVAGSFGFFVSFTFANANAFVGGNFPVGKIIAILKQCKSLIRESEF